MLLLRCSAALGKHVPEGREHLGDDVAGRRIASALSAAPSITARASGHAGGKPAWLAKPSPGWVEKRLRAMAIMEIKDSGSYL